MVALTELRQGRGQRGLRVNGVDSVAEVIKEMTSKTSTVMKEETLQVGVMSQ